MIGIAILLLALISLIKVVIAAIDATRSVGKLPTPSARYLRSQASPHRVPYVAPRRLQRAISPLDRS